LIDQVTTRNDIPSWSQLLQCPKKCLFAPPRGGKRWKLSSLVNNQISEESSNSGNFPSNLDCRGKVGARTQIDLLAARVSSKLEESDYKGAVRLVCSEDVFATHDSHTLEALRAKHPPPHPNLQTSDADYSAPLSFHLDTGVVMKAISSFPKGSGGGPDGLLPQHLKDLTGPTAGDGGVSLLSSLVGLLTLILEGRTPQAIRPIIFGANLIASTKKDGRI
jgi:hypothetical protein